MSKLNNHSVYSVLIDNNHKITLAYCGRIFKEDFFLVHYNGGLIQRIVPESFVKLYGKRKAYESFKLKTSENGISVSFHDPLVDGLSCDDVKKENGLYLSTDGRGAILVLNDGIISAHESRTFKTFHEKSEFFCEKKYVKQDIDYRYMISHFINTQIFKEILETIKAVKTAT